MSDDENGVGDVSETKNYIRFGKGKHTILVGKNQFLELLNKGLTTQEALIKLAESHGVFWVKGGEICQKMMLNQFKYLYNLGVPVDKIIDHFKTEFPVEFKCLTGEALSDEEIKKNIADLMFKLRSEDEGEGEGESESESEGDTENDEDTTESDEQETESGESEPAPEPESESDEPVTLGGITIESDEDLDLYLLEKEQCCGSNPFGFAMLTAIERLKSKQDADSLLKQYVINKWSVKEMFREACKLVGEQQLIDTSFDLIPESGFRTLLEKVESVDGREKSKDIYAKYLKDEITGLVRYVQDNYYTDEEISSLSD